MHTILTGLFAHAFGARYELPIPLVAFVLGGAAVVAASFAVVLPTRVRPAPDAAAPDRTVVRRVGHLAGPFGLVIVGLLCWAGLAGSQTVPENILPTVFWVYVWVVLPLLCGLLGDITSGGNPFGYLAQIGDSPRLRRALLGSAEAVNWPRWLGWWPAALLAALGTLAELVFNASTTLPRFIAVMLILYGLLNLVLGALFGAEAWRQRGELFSVLFATWGRLGWFRFGAPGRRGPAGGLEAPFERTVSRSVFVLLLLVSISFDGLLSTPQWARFERNSISLGNTQGVEALRTTSFLLLVLAIYALFTLFAVGVSSAGGRHRGITATLSGLLPSLVPIAFGYLLAHYLQYVLVNGQLILPLLGAPGGSGTNLHLPFPFNDSYEVHAHFLPNGFYWYVDVVVIVAVHIVAVVLAHRQLGRTGRTAALARRAEYPWIIAMVAYTSLSLWLLAQPLTETTPAKAAAAALPRQPAAAASANVDAGRRG
ncbi:MAG TPA: hypothetical protein VGN54_04125 [Mycobacteriales bacterium]|jgi:hypothetical protein|nr:hypothetical protein [Mycobacteriales bacterium]